MMTLNEIKTKYGYNTPIFLSDLEKNNDPALRQYLSRKARSGQISKYAQGIYFFSESTLFGTSTLSTSKVIEKKYIRDGNDVYGYYDGMTFENILGLTTQMPNVVSVRTNKTAAKKREISLGGTKVIVRKSRINIDAKNAEILQLLDMISEMDRKRMNHFTDTIQSYIQDKDMSREQIKKYIDCYPAATAKKLIDTGVIYAFT